MTPERPGTAAEQRVVHVDEYGRPSIETTEVAALRAERDRLAAALERLAPPTPIWVPGPNGTDRCRDCWARVPGEYETFTPTHKPDCAWLEGRAALTPASGSELPDLDEHQITVVENVLYGAINEQRWQWSIDHCRSVAIDILDALQESKH